MGMAAVAGTMVAGWKGDGRLGVTRRESHDGASTWGVAGGRGVHEATSVAVAVVTRCDAVPASRAAAMGGETKG